MVTQGERLTAEADSSHADEVIKRIRKTVTCTIIREKHPQEMTTLRCLRGSDASDRGSE
jgi:hypothetical protein